MNAGFSTQILAQKLAKLNIAQQSIETLSHWCIFHHRHCRQVVETWDSEFHSAPCERRVSLLYLANDIMQNSKKEDNRYISEFLKIIPAALNDVFINGDDFGRHVVRRLVDIWEDRKILGSQGQILKEDFSRRYKELKYKSKKTDGELMEKVVSSYKHMLNAPIDEDTLMRECQVALSFVDNLNKEYGNNSYLGSSNGSGFVEELQEQHSILRNSIEQFKTSESLRATLISHLKEALHEQEFKMEQVRGQLRAAQSRYKKADDLCEKLGIHVARQEPSNQGLKNSSLSEVPDTFVSDSANADSLEKGQSITVMYSQEGDGGEHEILNSVWSSQAARDNIEQKIEEHSSGNKRQKVESDVYVPQTQSQPPLPPLPHPDTYQPPPPPPPPEDPPSPESSLPPSLPPPLPTSMPSSIPPPLQTPMPSSIPPRLQTPMPSSIPPPLQTPMPSSIPPPLQTPMPSPIPPPLQISMPFSIPPPLPTAMPVPAAPGPGMLYGAYQSFPPAVNYPMSNMPPRYLSAPNPRPSFQGLGGPFYGPPPYSAAPPPMNRK